MEGQYNRGILDHTKLYTGLQCIPNERQTASKIHIHRHILYQGGESYYIYIYTLGRSVLLRRVLDILKGRAL